MGRGYRVRLEVFDGPFDLLLHLVEEEKIDIWDIPIARITEQYLAHLDEMRELNIDVAAEFLVMAARLLSIKARMLLPPVAGDDDEEALDDPRFDLALSLMEYKLFRAAAMDLGERAAGRWGLVGRSEVYAVKPKGVRYDDPAKGVTLADLAKAFQRVLEAYKPPRPIRLPSVKVSVEEKVQSLRALLANRRKIDFSTLFERAAWRPELIATFLALLELVRQGEALARQPHPFGPIVIEARALGNRRPPERSAERGE